MVQPFYNLYLIQYNIHFQSVFSYALFQEDSARRARRGFDELNLGAAGKAHNAHVDSLQLVDVPEDFHDVLFCMNTGAGVTSSTKVKYSP